MYFKPLNLKSNSLYSKYIPEKYKKEKKFPSFTWENISYKAKSFMIELIEDDIHKKWQVFSGKKKKYSFHQVLNLFLQFSYY